MTLTSISPDRGPAAGYSAAMPFYLAAVLLVLISFPGWDFAGGVTIANVWMGLSFPFWFHAARLRAGPVLDPGAEAGVAFVLAATIFLIAWAFLSVIDADIPFRAGRSIASLASAIVIYFAVLGTITGPRLDAYVRIASITLALTCLASFVALANPTLHGALHEGDRARAFFKNPNQLGIAISTLMPVAIACFIVERQRRLLWGVCVSLFVVGLVLSGSKANLLLSGSTAGVIILSAVHILYTGPRRVAMMVVGLGAYVILMVIGYVLLSVLNPRAVAILTRFFSPDAEVQSLQSRAALWQYSIDQFMADPFFGQGAGQPIDFLDKAKQVSHSHNIILDYLRTLGLPGLVGFLIIAAAAVILSLGAMRMALASKHAAAHTRVITMGLATGSLAYLAANVSSDSMGPSTSPFFWVVFFLCLASRRRLVSRS